MPLQLHFILLRGWQTIFSCCIFFLTGNEYDQVWMESHFATTFSSSRTSFLMSLGCCWQQVILPKSATKCHRFQMFKYLFKDNTHQFLMNNLNVQRITMVRVSYFLMWTRWQDVFKKLILFSFSKLMLIQTFSSDTCSFTIHAHSSYTHTAKPFHFLIFLSPLLLKL